MKYALLLICILSIQGIGQTVAELQAKAKADKLKDVIIHYDKFKDQTTITTKPQNMVGSWEGGSAIFAAGMVGRGGQTFLLCTIGTGFQGNAMGGQPTEYLIGFQSGSKGIWQFQGDDNLYVLFDDQRLQLPALVNASDIQFDLFTTSINTVEKVYFRLSRADLKRIAEAHKMEFRIGNSKPRTWKPDWSKGLVQLLALTDLIEK